MNELLGFLAGAGMLVLIAVLFFAFLRQIGAVSGETARFLMQVAAIALFAGLVYFSAGALLFQTITGKLSSAADYPAYFHSAYLKNIYERIQNPSWSGVFTGFFVYLAHLFGKILFGQYQFAALALAWGMSCGALWLIGCRIRTLCGQHTAEQGTVLLAAMPGGVFLFLPGWMPLAFLMAGVFFYFLGKKLPFKKIGFSPVGYWIILSACSIGSAGITAALAMGHLA